MLSKITSFLFTQGNQCVTQHRPAEDIDSHRRQIALRMLRLLLEFTDLSVLIGNDDPESSCFFLRYRHNGNCYIRVMGLMIVQHYLIIHLIDVIP